MMSVTRRTEWTISTMISPASRIGLQSSLEALQMGLWIFTRARGTVMRTRPPALPSNRPVGHSERNCMSRSVPSVSCRFRVRAWVRRVISPSIWRASQLARAVGRTVDTGYATLSAELPGGGWRVGALIELLPAHSGVGELRLLQPALASLGKRPIGLIEPPHSPYGPGARIDRFAARFHRTD
jgi:hypothetical protein